MTASDRVYAIFLHVRVFNSATLVVQRHQKVTVAKPQRDFHFILTLPKVPGRRCTEKSLFKKLVNLVLIIVESRATDFLSAPDPNKNGRDQKVCYRSIFLSKITLQCYKPSNLQRLYSITISRHYWKFDISILRIKNDRRRQTLFLGHMAALDLIFRDVSPGPRP